MRGEVRGGTFVYSDAEADVVDHFSHVSYLERGVSGTEFQREFALNFGKLQNEAL